MREKLATVVGCLLFAVCFGGVGVFTGWMAGAMVYDGIRARDWTKVSAEVTGDSSYRYKWEGRTYESDRLTLLRMGSSDVDGSEEVAARLARAREDGKPVTVYVNPQDPTEAVAEPSIPWKFVVFMIPFVFGFGGVGFGALVFLGVSLIPAYMRPNFSDLLSGPAMLWIFAFFWNVISFPIAIAAVPEIVANGEWVGLLVLLFPLVGIGLIWGAISATLARLKRGKPTFEFSGIPRVGEVLSGFARFPRGVESGHRFIVRLECIRDDGSDENSTSTFWSREHDVKATISGGPRVPFRFDVAADLPPTGKQGRESYVWRVHVRPAEGGSLATESTEVRMARADLEPAVAPEKVEPPRGPLADALRQMVGEKFDKARWTPEQRAAFANMSASQQATVAKFINWAPNLKKVVITIVVTIVLLQFVFLFF